MRLQIILRRSGIAFLGIFSVTALQGQTTPTSAQPTNQAASRLIAARTAGPLEASTSPSPGLAATAVGLPSSGVLPLTPQPILKPTVTRSEGSPSARELRLWKGLLIAEHSAAVFDAWTTRESLQSGNGYERNPLLKPFANSAAIYPVLQVAPVGFDFLSRRMMRSQNRLLRKTWWLPQLVSTGASLWCGARNLRVADLKR